MNQAAIRKFATWARSHLLEAVARRAAVYGVTEKGIAAPQSETADSVVIGGRAYDRLVKEQRRLLVNDVTARGFAVVMDEVAYTWFNRLAALRFMEVNDFLPTGVRVFSSATAGKTEPDILTQALSVDLPVNRDEIHRLLDSHDDDALYRVLLVAQCNALSGPLPFLFERLHDHTELLLPDGLRHPDGFVEKLVGDIPEDDWRSIEIVGWLYQFYIADRKAAVDASKKPVAKEDMPAKTQLFTPRWIVEYMVQNSLGRLWLEMYPSSPLRGRMKYYVENPDDKDLGRVPMKPEEIRCLDDACGSGHILVVMFDLLAAVYQERGYEDRDIPALILRHNLTGIDIDRRACQLAAFALAMKARTLDRRWLSRGVYPHIVEIVESDGLDPRDALQIPKRELQAMRTGAGQVDDLFEGPKPEQMEIFDAPAQMDPDVLRGFADLFGLFHEAKNFGSLLTVSNGLAHKLLALRRVAEDWMRSGDTFISDFGMKVLPLVDQAETLAAKYQVVVANPPYMGNGYYNASLKKFLSDAYPEGKADLYGAFMLRHLGALAPAGMMAMITIPNWMFLSSFEELRSRLYATARLSSLVHIGRGVWGSDFGSVAFVAAKDHRPVAGVFKRLFRKQGEVKQNQALEAAFFDTSSFPEYRAATADFEKIPGSPVAYWGSRRVLQCFGVEGTLSSRGKLGKGSDSGNNDRFIRFWYEVEFRSMCVSCPSREDARATKRRFFPTHKGGGFRKWAGNSRDVVDWLDDGAAIKGEGSSLRNLRYYFQECVSWGKITSARFSCRFIPKGSIADDAGPSGYFGAKNLWALGLLNSKCTHAFLEVLSPTLNFQVGDLQRIPLPQTDSNFDVRVVEFLIEIARADWDSFETSWDFADLPLLRPGLKQTNLEATWNAWADHLRANIARMQELETENNRLWIEAYGLQDELEPDAPEGEITLARPDLAKDMAALVSYAIGCMMGRYALDKPGLILTDAGDTMREYATKIGKPLDSITFPADRDGVVPILDGAYFQDDGAQRLVEFLRVTFGPAALEQNLDFLADALVKRKTNESSRDALRRYLATQFFKDHCQTYKNRPIYWLFTSGPERAFQALVYLHRYRPDTLSRMRTEYLHELQRKLEREAEHLETESSTGGRAGTVAGKRLKTVRAQLRELKTFDERLKHFADQRIALDLDDGVKVNYRKFAPKSMEIVAPVQGVTNGKEDDE